MLDPAGPVTAATQDLLLDAVGLMLIVVLPVFVLIALIVWRYRAGSNAAYSPDWQGSRLFEIGIWFAPLVIVSLLGIMVWQRTHALDPYRPIAADTPPLLIQAVALDWQWLFIYPEQGIAAVNSLVVPAGRPVTIELTSNTVMNALSIPALAGQIYAMAGMKTELNLLAERKGQYPGRNSQFSGDGFSAQTFVAEATDNAGFQSFVDAAKADGRTLDMQSFATLAQPTIAGPVQMFGGVIPELFDAIMAGHEAMPGHAGHGSQKP